ncbi:MAG: 1,4-dihydroxy-2-naphthoate polyprenyltransferase [Deltaproteobacteria bacterium]|nr:MAG: 1,4-dihydroxy-2-naphthoate polyprenyltransferase [Deltaproteobacteria bacterium]
MEASAARRSRLGVWWLAIRPRTLVAGVVPVLVGLAAAERSGPLHTGVGWATLACAVLLQIATNLANDYFDHAHGIDTEERLGPLRVTQAGLLAPASVRAAMIGTLAVAAALGLWLVAVGGLPIALIGAASIAGAVAYSAGPWPLAAMGLGEVMAFAFFGMVAVNGTYYLQTRTIDAVSVLASLPVAFLVTAILVVNNLRDIPTDRATGKRTLAVRLGDRATRVEYTLLVLLAFASAIVLCLETGPWVLICFAALPTAIFEIRGVWRRRGRALNESLAGTARLELIFGLLLAGGLLA